jgi:predicted dehydrogenase
MEDMKMGDERKYGVLLIGGHRTHQESYALSFAEEPRCQLIAFSDEKDAPPDRVELNRGLAEELNLSYISDLDEALARDDVQIVSLCAETERRGKVGVRCAEAGKHLYLDKPMALNVEDAQAIVAAVKRAGVRSQMFTNIHTPWARTARQALQEGAVGALRAIHCDIFFAKGHPGSAPVGEKRREKPTVGRYTFIEAKREMFDVGVYAVTMVNWLTGKKVKSVFGTTANYFFKEHVGCDIEDFGTLMLTLEDGITATIAGGRMGWMSHPQGGVRRLHLVGTRDTLTFDSSQSRLEVFTDEPVFRPPPPHPLDPMGMWRSTQVESGMQPKRSWVSVDEENALGEFSAFVDCIENEVESEMNAEIAAESVAVISAGYQSAASGEVVELG